MIIAAERARVIKQQAEEAYRQANQALLKAMDELAEVEAAVRVESKQLKAVRITPTKTVVDWDGLKKDLGARVWNKLTDRVPSKEKLQEALDTEQLDSDVVAKRIHNEPGTSYVRFFWNEEEANAEGTQD